MERDCENYKEVLDKFWNMKCEIVYQILASDKQMQIVYDYEDFYYEIDENEGLISLLDGTNKENCTPIVVDELVKVTNLRDDDIYSDVVSFKSKEYIISICTLQEKPQLPRCEKCGKEIGLGKSSYYLNGTGEYGGYYDGFELRVRLCEECVYDFVGEQEVYCGNEYVDYYDEDFLVKVG